MFLIECELELQFGFIGSKLKGLGYYEKVPGFSCKSRFFSKRGVNTEKSGEHYRKGGWVSRLFSFMKHKTAASSLMQLLRLPFRTDWVTGPTKVLSASPHEGMNRLNLAHCC